jgi:hypothetical protein
MPLSPTPAEAHHRPLTSTATTILVIRDPGDQHRLLLRPCRAWDRLRARLLARSLDRRLAAGHPPESSRLLATRALVLVRPDQRQAVARNWEHLLTVAGHPSARPLGRLPLCRGRIVEAEPVVRRMLAALVAPRPVPVRGVAMAAALLSDGSGPLYNGHCALDLVAAVGQMTQQLDASASLVST